MNKDSTRAAARQGLGAEHVHIHPENGDRSTTVAVTRLPVTSKAIQAAATALLAKGYRPVILMPPGIDLSDERTTTGKEPGKRAWGLTDVTLDTIAHDVRRFNGKGTPGVGVCLGPDRAPGGKWLGDVEGDGPEAEESRRKLFGDNPPATRGWSSTRGSHELWTLDGDRMRSIVVRLKRFQVKEANSPGAFEVPELPGLELRFGGFKEDGSIKQIQSAVPPTPGTDGSPREWNGVEDVAEAPESFYQALEAIAGEAESADPPKLDLGAEIERKQRQAEHTNGRRPGAVERAIRYLNTCEPAISGSRGHNKQFKIACKVGPGFDLTPEITLEIIREHYNPRCEPPWSEKEMVHKVEDAFRLTRDRGWLLNADRQSPPVQTNGKHHHEPDKTATDGKTAHPSMFRNYSTTWSGKGKSRKPTNHPLRMDEIVRSLDGLAKGWPKRVGELLFRQSSDYEPIYLDSSTRLFSWTDSLAQVDWTKGSRFIPQERVYEHLRMNAERYNSIEPLPHWPARPDVYYMHQPLPAPVSGRLSDLLDFFCPATLVDRELIKAFVLTLFWGGQPGSRPAFLITGPDEDTEQGRGIGKSRMPQILGEELAGGIIDVAPTEQIPDVKTRMLSDAGRLARVALLDNVKTLRLSWADLEGLITTPVISGRMLYRGEGQRPNTIVWAITLNGASLSKDMAQRVAIIKLERPTFGGCWETDVRTFIREHRWEIISEIGQILESKTSIPESKSRWAAWEKEVLSKVTGTADCMTVIANRQGLVDDDNEERDQIGAYFAERLTTYGHDPVKDCIFIPSLDAARWLSEATRKNYATNGASTYLGGLGITQLKKERSKTARGWIWTGEECELKNDPTRKPTKLNEPPWSVRVGMATARQ